LVLIHGLDPLLELSTFFTIFFESCSVIPSPTPCHKSLQWNHTESEMKTLGIGCILREDATSKKTCFKSCNKKVTHSIRLTGPKRGFITQTSDPKEGLGLWAVEERAIKRCATMQTLSEGENMALGGAAAFVEAVSVCTAHCVSQFGPVAWECRAQLPYIRVCRPPLR